MNAAANDGELDEASLVKLYMDLTGANESSARSVYMFVKKEAEEEQYQTNGLDKWRTEKEVQPFVAKSSLLRSESDNEFGIGLLGSDGLAFAGK
jgi:viroplasmin and RNaseH domain-containing protein